MAHDAEYDCAQGEQQSPLGDEPPGMGLGGGQLRWVCGAAPHPVGPVERVAADRTVAGERDAAAERDASGRPGAEWPARVPWQRHGGSRDDGSTDASDPDDSVDPRSGCRMERPGWAGGHRHGGVRPQPRAHRRERPPRRWC